MTHRHRHRRCAQALAPIALTALLAAPLPALAQDLAWSGFATLGYAHSADAPGRYLRWIDSNGTFNADSVAALQLVGRSAAQGRAIGARGQPLVAAAGLGLSGLAAQ